MSDHEEDTGQPELLDADPNTGQRQAEQALANIKAVSSAMTDFDAVRAALAELHLRYAGFTRDATTKEGLKELTVARAAVRAPRLSVERIRKAGKAPLLELGRNIDTTAAWITSQLRQLEDPIHAQIQAEERRQEEEAERRRLEREQRRADIERRINQLAGVAQRAASLSAEEITAKIVWLTEMPIKRQNFDDRTEEAKAVRQDVLKQLEQLHERAARAEQDAEAAEKLRQENEAAKAAAEHQQMLMQELQGIQYQLIIAQSGRLGVRVGGTIECMRETLAETQTWNLDPEHWGPMLPVAQNTKSMVIMGIESMISKAEALAIAPPPPPALSPDPVEPVSGTAAALLEALDPDAGDEPDVAPDERVNVGFNPTPDEPEPEVELRQAEVDQGPIETGEHEAVTPAPAPPAPTEDATLGVTDINRAVTVTGFTLSASFIEGTLGVMRAGERRGAPLWTRTQQRVIYRNLSETLHRLADSLEPYPPTTASPAITTGEQP